MEKKQSEENKVKQNLEQLAKLQVILSEIDSIQQLRGDLPLEIERLEKALEMLIEDVTKKSNEMDQNNANFNENNAIIEKNKSTIEVWEKKLKSAKDNSEYRTLTDNIEFLNLDINDKEKKNDELLENLQNIKDTIAEKKIEETTIKEDLQSKKEKLDNIIKETEKKELELSKKAEAIQTKMAKEKELLNTFFKIRNKIFNHKAIVALQPNEVCGGCFNKIPPQIQVEILQNKKIIYCEHCGCMITTKEAFN